MPGADDIQPALPRQVAAFGFEAGQQCVHAHGKCHERKQASRAGHPPVPPRGPVTLALRQQQHRQQGDDQASDGAAARGRSQNGRQQEEQRQSPERAHGAAAAVRSRIAARGCRGLAKEQYGQRHGHGDVAGEVIAVGKGADDPPRPLTSPKDRPGNGPICSSPSIACATAKTTKAWTSRCKWAGEQKQARRNAAIKGMPASTDVHVASGMRLSARYPLRRTLVPPPTPAA
jgi:hypothetical protein